MDVGAIGKEKGKYKGKGKGKHKGKGKGYNNYGYNGYEFNEGKGQQLGYAHEKCRKGYGGHGNDANKGKSKGSKGAKGKDATNIYYKCGRYAKSEPNVYRKNTGTVFVMVYVDDLALTLRHDGTWYETEDDLRVEQ